MLRKFLCKIGFHKLEKPRWLRAKGGMFLGDNYLMCRIWHCSGCGKDIVTDRKWINDF